MNDTYTPHNLPLQTGIIDQLSFINELIDATSKFEVYI